MIAAIAEAIGKEIGSRLEPEPASRVHGGSINECYRWNTVSAPVFVKVASAGDRAMLEAEAAGLEQLRGANAVRVPRVLGVGADPNNAWLALEWIELAASSAPCERLLGERLALQHRVSAAGFGWSRDNTIGSTPQVNGWLGDWVEFFRDRRLQPQLVRAAENGHGGELQRRGAVLLDRLGEFFTAHRPVPSLLHGDLWGGNWGADERGNPVIFDPAVYYGDREADLAMTHLFGGFGADFYSAYEAAWSLDAGAAQRSRLYNLYHVLNHLNLFGEGYLAQAQSMIDRLLRDLQGA